MTRLSIARILVIVGLAIGLESLAATFSHIGDPLFTNSPEMFGGSTHAWYHALREGVGDVATIVLLLIVFFAPSRFRTPATWWLALVAMIGYYAPFWVGMPFNPALAAPNMEAELRHIAQAAGPMIGLLIARKDFYASA